MSHRRAAQDSSEVQFPIASCEAKKQRQDIEHRPPANSGNDEGNRFPCRINTMQAPGNVHHGTMIIQQMSQRCSKSHLKTKHAEPLTLQQL